MMLHPNSIPAPRISSNKSNVTQKIIELIAHRNIPRWLYCILMSLCSTSITKAYIKHGDRNNAWNFAWFCADLIAWKSQKKNSFANKRRLLNLLPVLVNDIYFILTLSNYPRSNKDALIRALLLTYKNILRFPNSNTDFHGWSYSQKQVNPKRDSVNNGVYMASLNRPHNVSSKKRAPLLKVLNNGQSNTFSQDKPGQWQIDHLQLKISTPNIQKLPPSVATQLKESEHKKLNRIIEWLDGKQKEQSISEHELKHNSRRKSVIAYKFKNTKFVNKTLLIQKSLYNMVSGSSNSIS